MFKYASYAFKAAREGVRSFSNWAKQPQVASAVNSQDPDAVASNMHAMRTRWGTASSIVEDFSHARDHNLKAFARPVANAMDGAMDGAEDLCDDVDHFGRNPHLIARFAFSALATAFGISAAQAQDRDVNENPQNDLAQVAPVPVH